jgi:hypothetical protein
MLKAILDINNHLHTSVVLAYFLMHSIASLALFIPCRETYLDTFAYFAHDVARLHGGGVFDD